MKYFGDDKQLNNHFIERATTPGTNVRALATELKKEKSRSTKAEIFRWKIWKSRLIVNRKRKKEVCQQFFINHSTSTKAVFTISSVKRESGVQWHVQHKKITSKNSSLKSKRDKFQAVESHYCSKNTKKLYLEQILNVTRMYRMYTAETEAQLLSIL